MPRIAAIAVIVLSLAVSLFFLKPVTEQKVSLGAGAWTYTADHPEAVEAVLTSDHSVVFKAKGEGTCDFVFTDENGNTAEYLVTVSGGNTFKLLKELKESGAFDNIAGYLQRDGIVFGGSAGAIILGRSIEVAGFMDENEVGLKDLSGFDVYNGNSLFCHFEGSGESRAYIRKLSEKMSVHALTEETTIFINGEEIEIIGDGLFTSIASFRPNWWAFMKGTDITTLPILPITVAERIICMKRILSKFKR